MILILKIKHFLTRIKILSGTLLRYCLFLTDGFFLQLGIDSIYQLQIMLPNNIVPI